MSASSSSRRLGDKTAQAKPSGDQPRRKAPSAQDRPDLRQGDKLAGGLYLVATPIGNLQDFTPRAKITLEQADLLLCEDTRVTRKLLQAWGIERQAPQRTASYREHNASAMQDSVLQVLAAGLSVALVSDAGLPMISDPGAPLLQAVIAAGYPVTVVPGANAALVGLMLSGLPSERFFFAGFLPSRQMQRRQAISELAQISATLIFYESPQRVAESLADLAELLGARKAAVARELTKMYEEVKRDTLPALADYYAQHEARGEMVVVVDGAASMAEQDAEQVHDVPALLKAAFADGASVRDATAIVVARTGLPRREVYAQAVALSRLDK